ncbi:MAG: hypothetical protein VYD19_00070 [Myxococcota bacterium]|nr:hypothetical protein [Myxococcota bacterium]
MSLTALNLLISLSCFTGWLSLLLAVAPSTRAPRATVEARTALASAGLEEISGLAASHQSPGIFWAHNDSGNRAEVIAIDTHGERVMALELPIPFVDPEDLSIASCPPGLEAVSGESCIWLADVGDNQHQRTHRSIWVMREPILARTQRKLNARPVEKLTRSELLELPISFPKKIDRLPNIEAISVSAAGDRFWLFEKGDRAEARVWQGGVEAATQEIKLRALPSLQSALLGWRAPQPRPARITSATLNAEGTRLFLRTYGAVFLFQLPHPYALDMLSLLQPKRLARVSADEPQGEALTLSADERTLWSASELRNGQQPPLRQWSLEEALQPAPFFISRGGDLERGWARLKGDREPEAAARSEFTL